MHRTIPRNGAQLCLRDRYEREYTKTIITSILSTVFLHFAGPKEVSASRTRTLPIHAGPQLASSGVQPTKNHATRNEIAFANALRALKEPPFNFPKFVASIHARRSRRRRSGTFESLNAGYPWRIAHRGARNLNSPATLCGSAVGPLASLIAA